MILPFEPILIPEPEVKAPIALVLVKKRFVPSVTPSVVSDEIFAFKFNWSITNALDALVAMLFVTVVAKDASLPSAAANSLSVFNEEGADATKLANSLFT